MKILPISAAIVALLGIIVADSIINAMYMFILYLFSLHFALGDV